jgi:hypothetical protein
MSEPVNIVLEKYDSEELAEANELIGDLFINANIENKRLKAENAKLRELVYDMLQDEERGHNDELTFDEHVERANELGVEFRG